MADVLSEVVLQLAESHSSFLLLSEQRGRVLRDGENITDVTALSTTSSQKIHDATIGPYFTEENAHRPLRQRIKKYTCVAGQTLQKLLILPSHFNVFDCDDESQNRELLLRIKKWVLGDGKSSKLVMKAQKKAPACAV